MFNKKLLIVSSLLIAGATLVTSSAVLAATTAKATVKTSAKTVAAKTTAKATVKKAAVKTVAKPVLSGQVVSTSTTKIVVKSGAKTYTISSAKTKISRQSGATTTTAIAAKDLKKGETVAIFGSLSKSTITATSLVAGYKESGDKSGGNLPGQNGTSTPAFGQGFPGGNASGTPEFGFNGRNGLFGTVTALDGSSLTLETMARGNASSTDTYTVTLTDTTIYSQDQTAGTISNVVVGSKVMVSGTIDANAKTATATKIDVITKTPSQPDQSAPTSAN
jgi:hypothetical protein